MSSTPKSKQQNKMGTRSGLKTDSNSKPPQKHKDRSKVKDDTVEGDRTLLQATTTSDENNDSATRFVCSVCKNTESIRNNRLILETELLSEQMNKFDEIRSNLIDHASQIETLDLHVRHLLLKKEDFENYQDRVNLIDKKCDQIKTDIAALNVLSKVEHKPSPNPSLSESDISNVCDKLSNSLDVKLDSISQSIDAIHTRTAPKKKQVPPFFPDRHIITPDPLIINDPFVNPCDHIVKYIPNFVSSELSTELIQFLENENFHDKRGRSVASYGKPYKYNGSHDDDHKSSDIPVPIQKLISKIESEFQGDDTAINSCLVNCYTGEDSFLPPHADDEATIKPQSLIFSISIGATANILYKDNLSNRSELLSAEDRSLYIMSQQSQQFWKHQIKEDVSDRATRYSLTFRCVGDEYKNSTLIIGDSNTRHLSFGDEKKTFGPDLPGKRVQAYTIEDISPEACIGYQNIVVHVGVNNLKSTRIPGLFSDTKDINVWEQFKLYEAKINTIRSLCPRATLFLSPALPTKLRWLNHRILEFDRYINNYICANVRIRSFDFNNFADSDNLLRSEFASYKYKNDNIHLGSWGIITFARKIKASILKPHLDGRSFASVVRPDDGKSHSDDPLPS